MPHVAIGVRVKVLFCLAYLVCGIEAVAITLLVVTVFASVLAGLLYLPPWFTETTRALRCRLALPPLRRPRSRRARGV